jgi:hypothetical protein
MSGVEGSVIQENFPAGERIIAHPQRRAAVCYILHAHCMLVEAAAIAM